jgi:molybdenum cofactor cytidylyltransferase
VALVLAGGGSRRMGGPKLLLEHRGESLLARAIRVAAQACARVLVVVGAYADAYRPVVELVGATVVENSDWEEGLASSLRAGVVAAGQIERVLVVLADQPFVPAAHLQALLDEAERRDAELVFSHYPGGELGAPAVIGEALFARVMALEGDRGAKGLQRYADRVSEVALEDARDVDTPAEAEERLDEGASPPLPDS